MIYLMVAITEENIRMRGLNLEIEKWGLISVWIKM